MRTGLRRRAVLVVLTTTPSLLFAGLAIAGATRSNTADTATSKIAFVRTGTHPDQDLGDIHLMNADGSRQRNLTRDPAYYSDLVWSPNGGRIAFVAQKRVRPKGSAWATNIYVMDAGGTGLRQLTRTPWSDDPVWSPDGRRIAFLRHFAYPPGTSDDHLAEVYVVNADGSAKRRLTHDRLEESALAWSRSNRLAFVRAPRLEPDAHTRAEIFAMNPDGGDKRQLTHNRVEEGTLSWSPDGRKLAFSRRRGESVTLYVMNADGSAELRLFPRRRGPDYTNWPDVPAPPWSPDNSRVAFTGRGGDLYVVKPNGDALHKVAGKEPGSPTWSPDGRRIAFDRPPGIFIVNRDGSGEHRLVPRPGRPPFPAPENWGPAWQPRRQ
jgi:Tol biopolymer transport system component